RSTVPPGTTAAERSRIEADFSEARRSEADPARAAVLYESLLRRQPRFAEAHFRLARMLEREGKWAEARRHYVDARDDDGLPIRLPTDFQDIYRDVASRHPCVLIDGPAELEG